MSQTLRKLVDAARAVADADPGQIEATATLFGSSRRWLAPVSWAAGTLVLVVRGIKLIALNWRLALIELVPALWVWIAMWDLRHERLGAPPLRDVTTSAVLVALLIASAASVAAFWFNAVFGFAISLPHPRIRPAVHRANPFWRRLIGFGFAMGVVIVIGFALIPRAHNVWVYLAALSALYGLMLVTLVVVPARILGVTKQRMGPKQTIGRWAAGGALSAVAMAPGFIIARLGVALFEVPNLHVIGLVLLTAGTALYTAAMSSVKAVKLSMKLEPLG